MEEKNKGGMNNITSKYEGEITSKENSLSHINSITESDVTSKTDFMLKSKVMSVPGASDIVSMKGAFAGCKVADWKSAKANILRGNC